MFKLSNRRYTGAKTKLLASLNEIISHHISFNAKNNIFLDLFGGTGVVSEFFIKGKIFDYFIINDFLYSNHIIYQGFLEQKEFDLKKLEEIQKRYNLLTHTKENYYSKHFGGKFFSFNDAKNIGFIRDDLEKQLKQNDINQKEYHILLSSLFYSVDKIANTVGHYDAYRKNVLLKDKFKFELIEPIRTNKKIKIYRKDANWLTKNLSNDFLKNKIKCVFLDPPYNSRQYSRFYHLLENLAKNDKSELFGVAKKPKPENISGYCKVEAKELFKDLIENLAKISEYVVLTYNNTYNANVRSNVRINNNEINEILSSVGKLEIFEMDFKPFNSGKTDFKNHKERIFLCKID